MTSYISPFFLTVLVEDFYISAAKKMRGVWLVSRLSAASFCLTVSEKRSGESPAVCRVLG